MQIAMVEIIGWWLRMQIAMVETIDWWLKIQIAVVRDYRLMVENADPYGRDHQECNCYD